VILHVLDGLWARLDEFGMILVRNMKGWLVYIYWHEIGMHDNITLVGET